MVSHGAWLPVNRKPELVDYIGSLIHTSFGTEDYHMEHPGLRIKATGIDHVVVYVKDVSRARRFYVELLGMEVARENPGTAFLRCGQQQLALLERPQPWEESAGRDLNHIALQVESGSYEEVKASLEASGIVVRGRQGDPRCIYFQDPDGHQVQILAPRR